MTRKIGILIDYYGKAFVALIAMLWATASVAESVRGGLPVPMELVNLLRDGQYAELEHRFGALHTAYESGQTSDRILHYAYNSIFDSDPENEKRLSAWVEAYPESFVAHTVRGMYRENIGWLRRGDAYADKTSKEQFRSMSAWFELAMDDYIQAIRLNPRATMGYANLISIATAKGDRNLVDELVRGGLDRNPDSYSIRYKYMSYLVPWWYGGDVDASFEAINVAIEEVRSHVTAFPHLRPLLAFDRYLAARILKKADRYDEAHDFIDQAIEISDDWVFLMLKGSMYYWQGNYAKSFEYYVLADQQWPDCTCTMSWRAWNHSKQGNPEAAMQEWTRFLERLPYDFDALRSQASLLKDAGRYEEARDHLDRAMVYGSHIVQVRSLRGRLAYEGFQDAEAALVDLEAAVALAPDRAEDRYWTGNVLYDLNSCKATSAYRKFLELCSGGADCDRDWVSSAQSRFVELVMERCQSG